jgi:ABC-type nitrate/sulfonate/bicarbonate transport system substrate-binding protein
MRTRRSILQAGLGSLTAAAIARTSAQGAPALEPVHVVIPANTVFVLAWLGANDAGIFAKHGIALSVDVRPFAGFLAGMPSKECLVTTYSGVNAIKKINEGLDWVVLGPGLTICEDIIVRTESPLKTVADLRGKKFGTFSMAGAYQTVRAILIDAYNLDLTKDTKLELIAPPALFKFLEDGRVDAMVDLTSFSVAAEAEPQKFRALFSPNDYWIKKTGYPIVWSGPLVAWRSWVDENPQRAKNLAAATRDMFRWLEKPQNLRTAVKNHGKLAGITKPEVVAEYIAFLDNKHMFMTAWNQKAVEAQWKFLELYKSAGVIKKVPPMDKYALFVGS